MPEQPRRIAVATDPRSAEHVPPGFHPERPERLAAAVRGLDRSLQATDATRLELPPAMASAEQIERVHAVGYTEALLRALAGGEGWLDADTYFSRGSRDAALLAAGGACAMVDALMDGRADAGVLLARPPGHHATPERPMGFCLLNNVAIAAAHARARGARRVAVVDWDVHHGNGTQAAFERDPAVLFISTHQWPLYPGTGAANEAGAGDGLGATINLPLPANTDGAGYRAAFERVVLPALEAASPDLVLVSAGFDAHRRDPIAQMALDAEDFGWMASALADTVGARPIGLVLEGGYDLVALEESVASAMTAVITRRPASRAGATTRPDVDDAIARTMAVQRPYWARGVF